MEQLPPYDLSSSVSTWDLGDAAHQESRIDIDNSQSVGIGFSDMLTGSVRIVPKDAADLLGVNVVLVRSESLDSEKHPLGVEQIYTAIASCHLPMDLVLLPGVGYKISFSLRVPDREDFYEKQIVPIPTIGTSLLLWNNAERVAVRYYLKATVDGRGKLPQIRPSQTIKFSPAPSPLCPSELLRTSQTFSTFEQQLYHRGAIFRSKKKFQATLLAKASPIVHDWKADKGTTSLRFELFDFDESMAHELPATMTLSTSLYRQLDVSTHTSKKGFQRQKRKILLRFCKKQYACRWIEEDSGQPSPRLTLSIELPYNAPSFMAAPFDDSHLSLSYSMRINCQIARENFDLVVPFIPNVQPSDSKEAPICPPPEY